MSGRLLTLLLAMLVGDGGGETGRPSDSAPGAVRQEDARPAAREFRERAWVRCPGPGVVEEESSS